MARPRYDSTRNVADTSLINGYTPGLYCYLEGFDPKPQTGPRSFSRAVRRISKEEERARWVQWLDPPRRLAGITPQTCSHPSERLERTHFATCDLWGPPPVRQLILHPVSWRGPPLTSRVVGHPPEATLAFLSLSPSTPPSGLCEEAVHLLATCPNKLFIGSVILELRYPCC